MARYPAKTPRWATLQYGGYGASWDLAKAQCRALLLQWAREGRFGFYAEVSRHVTAVAWPEGPHTHEGQQMSYLLGQVALEELGRTEDRPLLSALVIGQEEGMPSHGFWTFLSDLGVEPPRDELGRLSYWQAEFVRARDHYRAQDPAVRR